MIDFFLGAIAISCVISATLLIWLAVIGARTVLDWRRRWWRHARAVIELTHGEAALQAIREAGYRAFDEYADQAIAITGAWSDEENEILAGRRPLP